MQTLVHDPIDVMTLRNRIARAEDGAVVVFEGIVRNRARGRRVLHLEYHAYETMAEKKLEEVRQLALAQFPIRDISVVHRLGKLEIGDCSVAIVVASAHRPAAFDACRFTIDTLKKVVPIWKKEFYEDGEIWIEGDNSGGG